MRSESLAARSRELNHSTAPNWHLFSSHRERVTRLVLNALSHHSGGRVCVLGAGNCNDLSLSELAGQASEIHLIDIDGSALERATARVEARPEHEQGERAAVISHPGIDVTGLGSEVLNGSISADAIAERALRGPRLHIGQPFDVVVSAGLLTQLISIPVEALGQGHPELTKAILAIRSCHLRLMCDLLVPGGHGVLVTDVVSSETLPELAMCPAKRLPELMAHALLTRNFFTGTHPVGLIDDLQTGSPGTGVDGIALSEPWCWRMGPSRSHLVVALTFVAARRPPPSGVR